MKRDDMEYYRGRVDNILYYMKRYADARLQGPEYLEAAQVWLEGAEFEYSHLMNCFEREVEPDPWDEPREECAECRGECDDCQ